MDDKEYYGVIYKITNLVNGKIYIGQTIKDIQVRFNAHCLRQKKYKSNISETINKYGKENFTIEIIEYCHNHKELDNREKQLIKTLSSLTPNGYNICLGGAGSSYEKRKRISQSLLSDKNPQGGRTRTNEWKVKMSTIMSGRKIDRDVVEKCRISRANNNEKGKEYKGINFRKYANGVKYRAELRWDKICHRSKTYNNIEEAAIAYNILVNSIRNGVGFKNTINYDSINDPIYKDYLKSMEKLKMSDIISKSEDKNIKPYSDIIGIRYKKDNKKFFAKIGNHTSKYFKTIEEAKLAHRFLIDKHSIKDREKATLSISEISDKKLRTKLIDMTIHYLITKEIVSIKNAS